jgi:fatty acid-binding protein DegV
MLGIKPFLTMEDGDLVPMEKVRSRLQAVEKLLEFVVEFSEASQVAILQSTPHHTEDTSLLLERLGLEFPGKQWPVLAYSPALGSYLGPNAMGVFIYEGEIEPE